MQFLPAVCLKIKKLMSYKIIDLEEFAWWTFGTFPPLNGMMEQKVSQTNPPQRGTQWQQWCRSCSRKPRQTWQLESSSSTLSEGQSLAELPLGEFSDIWRRRGSGSSWLEHGYRRHCWRLHLRSFVFAHTGSRERNIYLEKTETKHQNNWFIGNH